MSRSIVPAIRGELVRLYWRGLVGLVVFWVSRDWELALLTVVTLYLFTQVRNVVRLRGWVNHPRHVDLPAIDGLWGEVFDGLSNLQRRNRKRKKRLSSILAQFQASTAALPDGAVVLASHGEIIWFNNAAQVLLGLRSPQDYGQRIANLVRHPAFTNYFAQDDYPGEVEVPSQLTPNAVLSCRIIPYGDGQKLLIVRDVSEARGLEAARRDFVANASHELRTPLTVVHGYLDMMEPESEKQGPLAVWQMPLNEMRGQVARMEALISDLLKLARLESEVSQSRRDLLDVPQMLERERTGAAALSKGQHHFEFEIDPELLLYGREGEIHSVFSNLIANAVNYTLPGGIVRVRWWSDARGAHFAVADSGIGISEKDLPRITERFYRVDIGRSRSSGGTGLGLSIVKHALEQHGARLHVESELGVGSTFTCEFPAHRVYRKPRESARQSPPNLERRHH